MKVSIDVKRFDPEKTNENTWVQNYKMDIHPSSTVLDALIHHIFLQFFFPLFKLNEDRF